MKEQILKMLAEMDEKELKEVISCMMQVKFDTGLDYSTDKLENLIAFGWEVFTKH